MPTIERHDFFFVRMCTNPDLPGTFFLFLTLGTASNFFDGEMVLTIAVGTLALVFSTSIYVRSFANMTLGCKNRN